MDAEAAVRILKETLQQFETRKSDLEFNVNVERGKLKEIEVAINKARDTYNEKKLELDTELEKDGLVVTVQKAEKQKLIDDNQTLQAQNSSLKVENVRLMQANEKYRKYEAESRKALLAADESLKARAEAIGHKEQLRPINKSYLPPRA